MPTTNTHRFWDTQPITSTALLSNQLMITPMMPGKTSAAFMPNLSSSDAKALRLFLSHAFTSLGGGGSPPTTPPPPGSNASMSTLIVISIAVITEAIIIPCSLNSVLIFSANEVSLSNTFAIVSLILVIWFFSLPLRRSILSCLTFSSSFSFVIRLVIFSQMPLS